MYVHHITLVTTGQYSLLYMQPFSSREVDYWKQ